MFAAIGRPADRKSGQGQAQLDSGFASAAPWRAARPGSWERKAWGGEGERPRQSERCAWEGRWLPRTRRLDITSANL